MTSMEGNLNSSGLPLFHLRRVGPPPSKNGVVSVMDLYRITYMIGRSAVQVDFYIDSSNHIQSASISRCHARIVRQNGNQHRLYDDSLNGVFVNNMKIAGSCVLREGDKVTFGHPCGAKLPAGSRSRQPDSEHQFMFEMCSCDKSKSNKNGASGNNNQETLCFKKPVSPDEASCCKTFSRTKKTARKTTQCFTQDDVRKLKQAWDERQSGSSESDLDSDLDTQAESNIVKESQQVTAPVREQEGTVRKTAGISSNIEPMEARIAEQSVTVDHGRVDSGCESSDSVNVQTNTSSAEKEKIDINPENSVQKQKGKCALDESIKLSASGNNAKNIQHVNKNTKSDVSEESEEIENCNETSSNTETEQCMSGCLNGRTNEKESGDCGNNFEEMEGTFNSILKDLSELRETVESGDKSSDSSGQSHTLPTKSPTKDACIQTTQSLASSQDNVISTKSPTKEMGIQTSQAFVNESMQTNEMEIDANDSYASCPIEKSTLVTAEAEKDAEINQILNDDESSAVKSDTEEMEVNTGAEANTDAILGMMATGLENNTDEVSEKQLSNTDLENEDGSRKNVFVEQELVENTVVKLIDSKDRSVKNTDNICTDTIEMAVNDEKDCLVISESSRIGEVDDNFIEKSNDNITDPSGKHSIVLSDSIDFDNDAVLESEVDKSEIVFSNSIEYSDDESNENNEQSEILLSNSVEFSDDENYDNDDSENMEEMSETDENIDFEIGSVVDDKGGEQTSEVSNCSITYEAATGENIIGEIGDETIITEIDDDKGNGIKQVDETIVHEINDKGYNDENSFETAGDKTVLYLETDNAYETAVYEISDDTIDDEKTYEIPYDEKVLVQRPYTTESSETSFETAHEETPYESAFEETFVDDFADTTKDYEHETPFDELADEKVVDKTEKDETHLAKGDVKKGNGKEDIAEFAGNYLSVVKHSTANQFTDEPLEKVNANNDNEIYNTGYSSTGDLKEEVVAENDCYVDKKLAESLEVDQTRPEHENRCSDYDEMTISDTPKFDTDELRPVNEINRKRKISGLVLEYEPTGDSPRKRHCSQDDNVIVNGRKEEWIADQSSRNADVSIETSHNAEENGDMISSQNTLQKLKTGMKEFFKLWSKKSNNITENGSTESGYIYIQDTIGQYKLLDLEGPEKSSLNRVRYLDMEFDCNNLEKNTSEAKEMTNCDTEMDSVDETVKEVCMSKNHERSSSDGVSLEMEMCKESLEPQDQNNIENVRHKMKEGSKFFESGTNSCIDSQNKDTLSDVECVFNSENESASSPSEIVETSICQTDNEVDMNDMIKSSLIAATFKTPSKQTKDDLSRAGSSSPQLLSPVLKRIGSSQNINVNKLESPIITKLGNDTTCASLSGKLKEKVGKEHEEVASQLSCNFSDEDVNDFYSPDIDFSHLDDDDDDCDHDHGEDGKEVVDDKELEKDDLGIEKEVNSEDDITCDEEDARNDEQVDGFDNDDNWSETNDNGSATNDDGTETNDNGSETNDRDKDEENSDDDDILLHGHDKKKTNNYDVDFDFGDSEIDSDKETGMPQKSDADLNEDDDGDRNDNDEEEVALIDSDSQSENQVRVRSSVKRKCNFDTDPWLSKKRNTEEIEDLPSTSTPLKTANTDITTYFKTPVAFSKSRLPITPVSAKPSPDPVSSTQMIESSQTPDLDSLSLTQISEVTKQLEVKVTDRTKSNISRVKAKDLLEKLRARRRIKEEASSEFPSSSPTGNSSQTTEIELYNRTNNTQRSEAQLALLDVEKHVSSCKVVISKLKTVFDGCKSLHGHPRVQAWRKELIDVEKRLVFPMTVIAVVGDTGAGKSSLMNAILDHRSVLPTSGMRACTAVVVEVVQNTISTYLEADIEFLQRKEWFDELQVLLKDLTGLDGNIKKGVPDPTSDAFVSYCKVKAVYGKVDQFEVLSRLTTVTHWLDRVKVIKSKDPEEFRHLVEKYIETQEPGAGGQYWPIVKHVRLRLPNCDVCSSGAALVDLPGVRDSNAARDKIAKEYLKNCTAVWVVSSIHRAIDDKTAKDLLGENFRRQLLMDGQYGSIAFICTKTDVLMPSEIIRTLKLEDETKEHEDQVNAMEAEKSDLELTISKATREIRRLPKHVASLKKEVAELRDTLRELNNLLDPVDLEGSMSEEQEAIKEYEEEIKQKEEEISEAQDKIDQLHIDKQEASQKIMELENRLNVHRKAIAAICARARNEYSKSQIRRDFKAGLKEMKRRAGMLNNDDEEEDLFSDDSNDDDDELVGSSAENLKVFCCSSTEYQKMKNLLTDDGPPQVFSSLEDTQIPALRHYVHEMTSVRQKHSMERLIKNLGRFVSDVHMYISGGVDMKSGNRHFAKDTIDEELEKFRSSLSPVFEMLSAEINGVFDGSLRQKMEEGATNAADEANDTCAKWGRPYVRDRNEDKKQGGLHFATYRATVRRQGVYTSPTWGPVDFNEDLSEPMYRSMTIVWDRAFSGMLWRIVDKLPEQILGKLKQFTIELVGQLENLGITRDRGLRVSSQLHGSAETKLTEMVGHLKELITNKQRDISRLVTPHVQASLYSEYTYCVSESGQGMFMRIKDCLARGIDGKRMTMFDEAMRSLMAALVELQREVEEYVRQVCQSLIQDLRRAFEPLWEAPSNSMMLRSVFNQPISEASEAMHRIYDEAGLPRTEEYAIVPAGLGTITATNPAGPSRTVNSCGADGWQTFEKSFQKTENTEYGTKEQAGQLAVRVKTEKISPTCVSQTMETVSRVHTLHIKQEKPDLALNTGSCSDFGFQTLQDLQSGKLEISPVEVTVQTQPACSMTNYRPQPTILIVPNPDSIPCPGINKPLSSSSVYSATNMPNTFSVTRVQTPANIQHSLPQTFPTSSSHLQPNSSSLPVYNKMTSSQVFNQLHKTVNGVPVLKQQPTITNSAPNLKQQIVTKRTLLPATTVKHIPVTVHSIQNPGHPQTTNNSFPVLKCPPANINSSRSGSCGISQQGVILTTLLQSVKSATVGSHSSGQSAISATSSIQTPSISNYTISANTPKLNMVVGIENIESLSGKENGITSSQKRVLKGKKLSARASLSLSQRNSPVHSEPAPVIKAEPLDNGLYGRMNRPKFLGTIDLTDELPDLD